MREDVIVNLYPVMFIYVSPVFGNILGSPLPIDSYFLEYPVVSFEKKRQDSLL